jgi:hypothetical protein
MATYSSNKNCRSKSHSSTVGNWKHITYAKLVNPKATRACCKQPASYLFRKTFWLRIFSFQGLIEPCFMDVLIELLSHKDEHQRVELILDNSTFNFNSLLGIVYGSFSMQIPDGGRMWFRPAIFIWRVCGHFSSLRFKKTIIEKLNNSSFVLCKNWIV